MTVTGESSASVNFDYIANCFLMPAENVVVSVTFKEAEGGETPAEPEVFWGTSATDLPHSGTWDEFNLALTDYYYLDGAEVSYAKLNKDISGSLQIAPQKTLTFDLAGYDITSTNTVFYCNTGCNFTIIDSAETDGTVTVTRDGMDVIWASGTVNIKGGKLQHLELRYADHREQYRIFPHKRCNPQ